MSFFSTRLITFALAGLAVWMLFFNQKQAPHVNFMDLQGQQTSMEHLRGNVVLVNFWATSCMYCIEEMPELVETYEKYHANGLDIVAVAMQYDPPNYVVNFAETRRLPFHVTLDTQGKLAHAFGGLFGDISLTPTTFVINKKGRIIKSYVGKPDLNDLHQVLEKAMRA